MHYLYIFPEIAVSFFKAMLLKQGRFTVFGDLFSKAQKWGLSKMFLFKQARKRLNKKESGFYCMEPLIIFYAAPDFLPNFLCISRLSNGFFVNKYSVRIKMVCSKLICGFLDKTVPVLQLQVDSVRG